MKDPNWKPLEIEDLWKLGKAKNYCPYYAQQNKAGEADLIFMPYNYLLEDFSHEQSSLSLENAILIIDEAHNI
jgi:Rad3-related DNA helicase